MKQTYIRFKRLLLVVIGLAFSSVFALPALVSSPALAFNQPTSRSVQMSSSALGATGVQYTFQFTTSASDTGTTNVEGLVFEFCDDSPIIGNSCGYTSGVNGSASIASATLTSVAGTPDTTVGASDWQISSNSNSATAGNGVILALTDSNAAEGGTHYVAPGTTITVVVSNITNPNYNVAAGCANTPNCSFYMRMLAFPTTAGATGYAAQTIGSPSDAGGDALSTNSTISISATVQETLTFCVSGTTITGTCTGGLSTPALIIGHGSPQKTISSTATDTAQAYTQISTNAVHGSTVYMKASNTCNGLSSNGGTSCTIPGVGSSASPIPNGTTDFGMCVIPGTATVNATYLDSAHSCPTTWVSGELFGMGTTTATYGSAIYSESTGVNADSNTLNFAASAAATVPAGIYTGNEQLIATGIF